MSVWIIILLYRTIAFIKEPLRIQFFLECTAKKVSHGLSSVLKQGRHYHVMSRDQDQGYKSCLKSRDDVHYSHWYYARSDPRACCYILKHRGAHAFNLPVPFILSTLLRMFREFEMSFLNLNVKDCRKGNKASIQT